MFTYWFMSSPHLFITSCLQTLTISTLSFYDNAASISGFWLRRERRHSIDASMMIIEASCRLTCLSHLMTAPPYRILAGKFTHRCFPDFCYAIIMKAVNDRTAPQVWYIYQLRFQHCLLHLLSRLAIICFLLTSTVRAVFAHFLSSFTRLRFRFLFHYCRYLFFIL